MYSRKVSPFLLHLFVTLIYPQVGRPSPVSTNHALPSATTSSTQEQTLNPRNSTPAATIINSCSFPVYLWSVADTSSPCTTLSPTGGSFTEAYQQRASGGISLKIAFDNSLSGNISQLEYTVLADGPYVGIFWDLSHVNGQPFWEYGEQVVPTVNGGGKSDGTCESVVCTPGELCQDAYNRSDDDQATHECPLGTDLLYTLCSGGNGTEAGAGSGAESGAATGSGPASAPGSVLGPPTTAMATSGGGGDLQVVTPMAAAVSTPDSKGQGQGAVQTVVTSITSAVTVVAGSPDAQEVVETVTTSCQSTVAGGSGTGGLVLAYPTGGGNVEELKS